MLLPFRSGLVRTSPFDPECAALADRHYSRQTHGSPQFAGNGQKVILRDGEARELFVWLWQTYRLDGQAGYNAAMFRNEGSRLSSDVILEAERCVVAAWGPNRAFTYVDPIKVRSPNPGYCFKVAGWIRVGESRAGAHLLEKWLRA